MGRKISNLIWKRYWRLLVIWFDSHVWKKTTKWLCRCECWNEKIVTTSNLNSLHTNSCWCLIHEKRPRTHWMTNTKIYSIFHWVLNRCNNTRIFHKDYKYYSSKWIKCEWNTFESFYHDMYKSYLKHISEYWEKNTQLDRKDSSLNYNKKNCRRVTIKENIYNRKYTRKIKYEWKIYSMIELAKYLWLPRSTLYNKIKRWEIII